MLDWEKLKASSIHKLENMVISEPAWADRLRMSRAVPDTHWTAAEARLSPEAREEMLSYYEAYC